MYILLPEIVQFYFSHEYPKLTNCLCFCLYTQRIRHTISQKGINCIFITLETYFENIGIFGSIFLPKIMYASSVHEPFYIWKLFTAQY